MQLYLLMSFLVVCVGSGVVGVRLVLAGLRTRTVPELAYGASLVLMTLGAITRLVVVGILGGGPEYHGLMIAAGVTRQLTLMALSLGILVIFRPDAAWAKVLTAGFWLLGFASLAVTIAHPGGFESAGPIYQLGDLAAGVVAAWGCLESFSYYGKLKRRLSLGLADPVTAAQFWTWGMSFALASVAGTIVAVATVVLNAPITTAPAILASVQGCLVVMTIGTWFAFYPPTWWRERIVAHAAALAAD